MRRSDSRRTFSPRFVGASRDDTTPCACVRLSVQARRRPGARGFVVWQPPRPLYRDGAAGRPKFLGGPGVPMPCSSTPAKPPPPGRCGGAARPPCLSKPRAFAGSTLGAPEHGLGTGCLRFVGWGAPSRRKTRLPLRARLDGVGLITHRAPTKGFEGVFVTSSPPLPSFSWPKDSLPRCGRSNGLRKKGCAAAASAPYGRSDVPPELCIDCHRGLTEDPCLRCALPRPPSQDGPPCG